ncbi:MAG: CDP-diacylglycerol--serine O-phosphatidyltransferase [Myxococcota bacterium]
MTKRRRTFEAFKKPLRIRRKAKARRRRRINLGKAMFVLPNLFTISSVFCGFYAIVLSSGDPGPVELYQATLAVFFGAFFDMADGRVARLTKTQSEFGTQLDSLADMVTFGVAPAVIVYTWGLSELGIAGAFVAFGYVACAAMRLARFNVIAARGGGASSFFTGLPTPLAAAVLVALVMFHQREFSREVTRHIQVVALVGILSYLMISNVRYRSFKDLRPSRSTFIVFGAVIIVFLTLALWVRSSFALLSFTSAYVVYGLIEEVVFFRRRRSEDKERKPVPAGPVENAES